jgi:hypothetical protein
MHVITGSAQEGRVSGRVQKQEQDATQIKPTRYDWSTDQVSLQCQYDHGDGYEPVVRGGRGVHEHAGSGNQEDGKRRTIHISMFSFPDSQSLS